MSSNEHTQRRQERYTFHQYVNYGVDSNSSNPGDKIFKGVTVNFSQSGLCLYVFHPLAEGNRIIISKDNNKDPHQTSTVRWVKKINEEVYKVGLMYID
jgi:hypothetical protein